jgi:hypothetical protein
LQPPMPPEHMRGLRDHSVKHHRKMLQRSIQID